MNPDLVPMLLDVSIDPCDGSVHPSLQYVLIRGFTAMGWEQPRSASEDMAMEILKMIRPSRLDAGGGVREALEKTSRALEELKAIVWGECPSLLNEDSGGNARLDIDIDEALEAAKAALSTPSDAVNESAEARLREALKAVRFNLIRFAGYTESSILIEGIDKALASTGTLWRPIETAPRDGTPFLAWEDEERGPFKCWWYENWPSDEAYWMDHACTEPQPAHWTPMLPKPAGGDGHDSDCATHNEPAYPNGPCNCSPAGGDEAKKSDGGKSNDNFPGGLKATDICIDCDGTGRYPSGACCKSCGGIGRVFDGDGIKSGPSDPPDRREIDQAHDWIKSTLGHGESMCSRCRITNREAAVLGRLNVCSRPASLDGGSDA